MAFTAKKVNFGISVEGDKALMKRFERAQKTVGEALQETLLISARATLKGAQARVPIRFGRLKTSGRLDVFTPATSPTQLIEVSFGKMPFVPYALVVHERVYDSRTGKIIRHRGRTQAKYLIEPFEREVAKLEKLAYDRLQRATIFKG